VQWNVIYIIFITSFNFEKQPYENGCIFFNHPAYTYMYICTYVYIYVHISRVSRESASRQQFPARWCVSWLASMTEDWASSMRVSVSVRKKLIRPSEWNSAALWTYRGGKVRYVRPTGGHARRTPDIRQDFTPKIASSEVILVRGQTGKYILIISWYLNTKWMKTIADIKSGIPGGAVSPGGKAAGPWSWRFTTICCQVMNGGDLYEGGW
jgi:hypothetical protein